MDGVRVLTSVVGDLTADNEENDQGNNHRSQKTQAGHQDEYDPAIFRTSGA